MIKTLLHSPILILLFIISSCSQGNQSKSMINDNDIITKKSISDPLELKYDFIKVGKLDDGISAYMYLEKGITTSKDGDYAWSKCIPLYASNEIKSTYEYQMDFTDEDFEALYEWLHKMIGKKAQIKSIDNPIWYKEEMNLRDIYNYCK